MRTRVHRLRVLHSHTHMPSTECVYTCAQNEKSMRREDSQKVQSLEAALQESQAELKAEKLLLQQVCLDSSLPVYLSACGVFVGKSAGC